MFIPDELPAESLGVLREEGLQLDHSGQPTTPVARRLCRQQAIDRPLKPTLQLCHDSHLLSEAVFARSADSLTRNESVPQSGGE